MLRFKAGSKLGENFYVRQDGTRSYFFTDGKITGLPICGYLIALSLTVLLVGVGMAVLISTHAQDPGTSSLTRAPYLEPGMTDPAPGCGELTGLLW